MKLPPFLLLPAWAALAATALGHDTWVQTNTAVIRAGDAVYVDLMLGNHGNDHRDFKLAGKAGLESCTLNVIAPDGTKFDLKPSLVDRGYAPKEGYWAAPFTPVKPGLYLIAQASDQIATYAPERVVRSAKTFFLVSKSLDQVGSDLPGFDRVLGHALELVPEASTVAPMAAGIPIKVRLLYRGKPLAGERISFIPQGQTLAEGFDPRYERRTDASGSASFEPKEANVFLVAAHHVDPAAGPGYKSTHYSATLTVLVPAICPCCGE